MPRFSRIGSALSTLVGATVALALLAGLGVWFYRLGVREPGTVPIIRAMAEPAKTRPEDPGGTVAPYQGVTSYGVAGSSPAQAGAVVVAPAPPAPAREDVAMGALAPQARAVAADGPGAVPPPRRAAVEESQTLAVLAPPDAAPGMAADATAAALTPAEAVAPPAADPAPPQPIDVPGATEHAPGLSPPAPPKPEDLKARVANAAREAAADAERLAAEAAASEVQIQLAADPSETTIRAQWVLIHDLNKDLLRDRTLAVQATQSGGTTWYRLRVGPFRDREEASAVCQALIARGQDCIVARNG